MHLAGLGAEEDEFLAEVMGALDLTGGQVEPKATMNQPVGNR